MRWIVDGDSRSSFGKSPWKDALTRTIPPAPQGASHQGVVVAFRLLQAAKTRDLDNLCESLFSVIVNAHGWFGRRRPNIHWWLATKQVSPNPGCVVKLTDAGPPALPESAPLFDEVFGGALPLRARDSAFGDWVLSRMVLPHPGGERFTICLQFGDPRANLGDIATGPVKHVIDCLYPVLGGIPGAPEDWRIDALQVEKGGEVEPGAVRIRVWTY